MPRFYKIKEEALVRNLDNFQRFLDVAAMSDSEIVNRQSKKAPSPSKKGAF